jgi:hypothetical protein
MAMRWMASQTRAKAAAVLMEVHVLLKAIKSTALNALSEQQAKGRKFLLYKH